MTMASQNRKTGSAAYAPSAGRPRRTATTRRIGRICTTCRMNVPLTMPTRSNASASPIRQALTNALFADFNARSGGSNADIRKSSNAVEVSTRAGERLELVVKTVAVLRGGEAVLDQSTEVLRP